VDPDVVSIGLAQILRSATETQFALIAYYFMPDHRGSTSPSRVGSDCGRDTDTSTFFAMTRQVSASLASA